MENIKELINKKYNLDLVKILNRNVVSKDKMTKNVKKACKYWGFDKEDKIKLIFFDEEKCVLAKWKDYFDQPCSELLVYGELSNKRLARNFVQDVANTKEI